MKKGSGTSSFFIRVVNSTKVDTVSLQVKSNKDICTHIFECKQKVWDIMTKAYKVINDCIIDSNEGYEVEFSHLILLTARKYQKSKKFHFRSHPKILVLDKQVKRTN